ncbi:MAG TPA: protein kinase [Kofleriaceae bacterium]|nr:protein kinase [Kofleriaceae bacterium]
MLVAGGALAERFELRRRLGAGGMGEVFEAFDRARGETIALKTLSRADGATLARFKREFRALQSIAHPNLVSLRELVRDGDQWFFTMELVGGKHFIEHVRDRGTGACDEAKLRPALAQLASALRALHAAGLVHRDVKSSNVMIGKDGRVVLLDFGLVTESDPARQSTEGRPVGTVEYMAPEQASGGKVSAATDWYAMGVLLFEALTGKVPHSGHILQILVDKQQVEPPRVDRLAPETSADLVALCADLLRIEPAARPTGDEIAARLGLEVEKPITASILPTSGAFVGRERELAALMSAFEGSRKRPIVQLVCGESGIGKSELVARFTALLGQEIVTLAGRCYERESVPFKAIDGVADGLAHYLGKLDTADAQALLPPHPQQLLRLFPVFQRVDAIAAAPAAGDEYADALEQRRRMFATLRELFARVGERVPLVITVDDLQWADADSYLLLRQLLRGPDAPPLLVLATVRSDDGAPDQIVERLAGLDVRKTMLGPLSVDESLALAQQLVPGVETRVDLARLMREAGGHPLFLQEMLRHQAQGAPGAPTLDDALWARIGLLQDDARHLLECVCIAGQPIGSEVAMHACRLEATAVGRAAASLRVASLAREVSRGRGLALEPYHDRVREAVQHRLGVEARRVHHARLAAALEAHGGRDPQLLLRHFVLGGMPERAARYAEEAATRSMDAHAFDQAADLWKTALELVPRKPDEKRRLQLQQGAALVAAGRGAEAAECYLAAVDGADPATRLDARKNAAEQLLISGRIERGIEVLFELLTDIGVHVPSTPRRALASLVYHRAKLRLRGLGFKERHRREIADADLVTLEVLRASAHGLAMVDSMRGADFQTRALVLALQSGYRPMIARLLVLESMFQSTQSSFARAAKLLDRAKEVAGAEPEPYMQAMLAGGYGLMNYFSGRIDPAVAGLREAIEGIKTVPGSTWELYTSRLFDVYAIRVRGDAVELRRLYDHHLADAAMRGDQYLDSSVRRACVPMWLAEDEPEEALRDLERATWVPDTTAFHVQHYLELIARGDIALYTGEPDEKIAPMFQRLEASLLRRITTIRVQTDYTRARLATVAGDVGAAAKIARSLCGQRNLSGQTWGWLVRGLLACSSDREAALRHFERARALADEHGMPLASALARYRTAELRDEPLTDALASLEALGFRAPHRAVDTFAPRPPR